MGGRQLAYLVCTGEHSYYHVWAVFTSEDRAEAWIKAKEDRGQRRRLRERPPRGHWYVEERPLDPEDEE